MSYYSENREKLLSYQKARYWQKREQLTAYQREYAKAHPRTREEEKARFARRRAAGDWKASDIREQYEQQQGMCAYCGAELGENYHADHYHPIAKGGLSTRDNLRLACPPCNLSKGACTYEEWTKREGATPCRRDSPELL